VSTPRGLLEEVLTAFAVSEGDGTWDATVRRGGHSAAILERVGPAGRVVAIDRDPQAAEAAAARFGGDERLVLCAGEFSRLAELTELQGVGTDLNGVLFDLGVFPAAARSSRARLQLSSFDGPLDMRMDNSAAARRPIGSHGE